MGNNHSVPGNYGYFYLVTLYNFEFVNSMSRSESLSFRDFVTWGTGERRAAFSSVLASWACSVLLSAWGSPRPPHDPWWFHTQRLPFQYV